MGLVKDGREQHYMWCVMCSIYIMMLSWDIYQISRIIYFQHRLSSFQGIFLLLCLAWTSLRVLFWLEDTSSWPNWFALTVYWSPILIQFNMFSLLVFFYAKFVHFNEWESVKTRCYVFYVVSNVVFSVTTVYWIIVEERQYDYGEVQFFFSLISGLMFGLLFVGLVLYGYRVYCMELSRRVNIRHPFASATSMVGLTLFSALVFLTRCLYGLLQAIFGWHIVPIPVGTTRAEPVAGSSIVMGWKVIDYPTFVLNIAWEILPTVALLYFFKQIPRSHDTLYRSICRFLCGRGKSANGRLSALSTPLSASAMSHRSSGGGNGEYAHLGDSAIVLPRDEDDIAERNRLDVAVQDDDDLVVVGSTWPPSRGDSATAAPENATTTVLSSRSNGASGGHARSPATTATEPRKIQVRVSAESRARMQFPRSTGGDTTASSMSSVSPRKARLRTIEERAGSSVQSMHKGSGLVSSSIHNSNASDFGRPFFWPRNNTASSDNSDTSPYIGAQSAERRTAFTPGLGWNLPPPLKGRSDSMEPRDYLFRASSPSAKSSIFPSIRKKHARKGSKHGQNSSLSDDGTGAGGSPASPRRR